MPRRSPSRSVLASLLAATALACEAADAGLVKAIEYIGDHVVLVADPGEVAVLDRGGVAGWQRTGVELWVYDADAPGVIPLHRFYSAAFAPHGSHFYTADPAEIAAVRANPDWVDEGVAFYVRPPDANGHCGPGSAPVYRWFNKGQGGTPRHRFTPYTPQAATYPPEAGATPLAAAGWTLEGRGTGHAAFCMHWSESEPFDLEMPVLALLRELPYTAWNVVRAGGTFPIYLRHTQYGANRYPSGVWGYPSPAGGWPAHGEWAFASGDLQRGSLVIHWSYQDELFGDDYTSAWAEVERVTRDRMVGVLCGEPSRWTRRAERDLAECEWVVLERL